MENLKLLTGQIEVAIEKLEILNIAKTPPFEIDNAEKTAEEIRLVNRYIDLRRPAMLEKIKTPMPSKAGPPNLSSFRRSTPGKPRLSINISQARTRSGAISRGSPKKPAASGAPRKQTREVVNLMPA